METRNLTGLDESDIDDILSAVREHDSLAMAVDAWTKRRTGGGSDLAIPSVVAQDEYSQDVAIPWNDRFVVVYAST